MRGNPTGHRPKRGAKTFVRIEAHIQRAIAHIADSDCPVLIAGEYGVGKRAVAQQIHLRSRRFRAAFTEIDCAEVNPPVLRSALSSNGTIYLSEVGDLSLPLQEEIIETCFQAPPPSGCRLLFGTSRDLRGDVQSWCMREDFYYLIASVTLHISPLRCRKSEILSLADELLTEYSIQFDRPKPVLRNEIIGFLMDHTWPENLPEFETAIKTFVAIDNQSVSLAALKAALPTPKSNGHRMPLLLKEATRAASTQIERRLITEVLASTNGNRKRAAAELGISYKALLYKLKQIPTNHLSASHRGGVSL
ncbi:MAG TPA: sigma 54-interacting transcriptional regulator [Terracidiphilus sp.]|nr:sigma 54-interacting transcriptional regulator [Terracidiphilus sp.]